jgi:hypothetical protein
MMASRFKIDLLTDKPSELLRGLQGLQTTIKPNRRLDIAVSKKPADRLVIARLVFEIDCCGSMPELVNRESKSGRVLHAHSDLLAELKFLLRLSSLAWEQPGRVCATQQRRPESMNVLFDEVCQRLIELEVQVNTIFHIVIWKHQPIWRFSASTHQ